MLYTLISQGNVVLFISRLEFSFNVADDVRGDVSSISICHTTQGEKWYEWVRTELNSEVWSQHAFTIQNREMLNGGFHIIGLYSIFLTGILLVMDVMGTAQMLQGLYKNGLPIHSNMQDGKRYRADAVSDLDLVSWCQEIPG